MGTECENELGLFDFLFFDLVLAYVCLCILQDSIYQGFPTRMVCLNYILRVSDQNGVYLLYIMLEIHHSGWGPSIFPRTN